MSKLTEKRGSSSVEAMNKLKFAYQCKDIKVSNTVVPVYQSQKKPLKQSIAKSRRDTQPKIDTADNTKTNRKKNKQNARTLKKGQKPRSKSCDLFPEEKIITHDCVEVINRLEAEKLKLEKEIHVHKVVLRNSTDIIRTMTQFYFLSFKEITEAGFDLKSLDTIQGLTDDSQLASLKS